MASSSAQASSTSPKLAQSQISPLSLQYVSQQHTTTDGSHHHANIPRHQTDSDEYKENDDRTTSASVFRSIPDTNDDSENIKNRNERKTSMPLTITKDEKLSVAEEMLKSSPLSSNRIITATDVQSDNNEVSSFNHDISSNGTSTTLHSVSSDVSSPTPRFIPSSFDQQPSINENKESMSTLLPSTTTSSSLLMCEQTNPGNDKYLENRNQTNKDTLIDNDQTRTPASDNVVEGNQSLFFFLMGKEQKSEFFIS